MALTKIDDRGLKTPIDLLDNEKLRLGNGNDLEIFHNGSHSRILDSGDGKLQLGSDTEVEILNGSFNESMAKFKPNGAVELYYDNTKQLATHTDAIYIQTNADQGRIRLADTSGNIAYQITGQDVASSGESGGRLVIQDANGGVFLDARTSGGNCFVYNSLLLTGNGTLDNLKLALGAGSDLQLYHDGSNSFIKNSTGGLDLNSDTIHLRNGANTETYARFLANGAAELYHDNSKKLSTDSNGVKINSSSLYIDSDNEFVAVGAGDDLKIFHDGSHSKISNSTGFLVQRSNRYKLSNLSEDHTYIKVPTHEGGVELYHDNIKKFETTADGIDVSGAAIFHSVGVSNALDIEQQSDANYTGIKIRNFFTGSAKNMLVFLDNNGSVRGSIVINNTVTTYNTTSDYRIKENVVNLTDGITRLKKLKPYKFNFIGDSSNTVDGFFAHEASTVVPEAVTGTKDAVVTQAMIDAGEYTSDKLDQEIHQGIDQSKLVPLLTAALQEEISKREALETRVAALEAA